LIKICDAKLSGKLKLHEINTCAIVIFTFDSFTLAKEVEAVIIIEKFIYESDNQ